MRRFSLLFLAGVISLTACDNARKPVDSNFRQAINQYLIKHSEACTSIGREFPVDVTESEQKLESGISSQMAVLERVGLVRSSNTTAVVHGMMDALRGPTPTQPVKRYELTAEGQKYFRQTHGPLGQTGSFCYGQKTVDSIVKWTAPVAVATDSQSEVTYTYKIANLAPWAEMPDIQRVFWDVRTTIKGISKTTAVVGVQLTNQGWQVPQP
jgi:hypothetical protein